ncbi:MAG: DUF192 domain-containing protein [Guyparkeria sp.]
MNITIAPGVATRALSISLLLGALSLVAWLARGAPATDDGAERMIRLGDERFRVELATTPASHQLGLMHRPPLAQDRGMLFVFPDERPRSFWMKNVTFPIDILYLDTDWHVVDVHDSVPPCRSDPCPGYPSRQPTRYVLELPAGTAERLSLKPGTGLDPAVPAGSETGKAPN